MYEDAIIKSTKNCFKNRGEEESTIYTSMEIPH
jgi:hypothetical protein